MNSLTDEQLLLLSTVIYLDGIATSLERTLGDIVDKSLDDGLEKSRRKDEEDKDIYP